MNDRLAASGVGQGGGQLHIAEVIDPGDLGPQALAPVGQATVLDHAGAGDGPVNRGRWPSPSSSGRRAPAQGGRRRGEEVTPVEGPAVIVGRTLASELEGAGDRPTTDQLGRGDQDAVVRPDEEGRSSVDRLALQTQSPAGRADAGIDHGQDDA